MKHFLSKGIMFLMFIAAAIVIYSCKDNATNPTVVTYDANSINGTVSFVDTIFIADTTHGYYSINAYSTWPPAAGPTAYSKIYPTKSGGRYTANYKIVLPSDGAYTITTSFIKLPYGPGSVLGLGMYDVSPNDTTHSASIIYGNHPKATITSGAGIGNINFNSWIDTTKKIYKF